jgi:hypothetical protein
MTKNNSEMERVFISADTFQTIPSHHLSLKMKEWKGRFLKKRNSWTVLARYQEDIENFLMVQEEMKKEEKNISNTLNDTLHGTLHGTLHDTLHLDDKNNNNDNNLPLLSSTLQHEINLEIPLPIYELLEWMWKEIGKN